MKLTKEAAATQMTWLIVIVVLLLFFAFIYNYGYFGWLRKGATGINEQFDKAGDPDNDNVINLVDKCPCKFGDADNNGCPIGIKPTENEDKACLTKKT